jgi:hypothetical protein
MLGLILFGFATLVIAFAVYLSVWGPDTKATGGAVSLLTALSGVTYFAGYQVLGIRELRSIFSP